MVLVYCEYFVESSEMCIWWMVAIYDDNVLHSAKRCRVVGHILCF